MKKILAITLATCTLASIALSAVACNKVDSGTEAAKLLLANQRLDENLVGKKLDLGTVVESSKTVPTATSSIATNDTATALATKTTQRQVPQKAFAKNTATPTKETSSATWSPDFAQYSYSLEEFTQFLKSIENRMIEVAEDITHMKTKVGITDKWVKRLTEEQMLRVQEDRDELYTRRKNSYHVHYRYTNENASNVYESYSFESYNDGSGIVRNVFIPGERYEYMFQHSNGFYDYFIADNSRGYWMNTRFSFLDVEGEGKSANFFPYIIKDGLGIGATLSMHEGWGDVGIQNGGYSIFDPNADRELFRVMEWENSYEFNLSTAAIRNGLTSVSASDFYYHAHANKPISHYLDTLTTKNGTYQKTETTNLPEDQFKFTGGDMHYHESKKQHYGNIQFSIKDEDLSLNNASKKFEDHMNDIGLSLYCDMDAVAGSLNHASLLAQNFGETFTWNGYEMNSIANVVSAWNILQDQLETAQADYDKVKNFEVVRDRQQLDKNVSFAPLTVATNANNNFEGEKLSISNLSVSTNDTTLFEAGTEYVAKIGLALLDANGNPSATNIVPISGAKSTAVLFNGNSISLTISGEYSIPETLDQGDYAVVAYIVTKDEGIRVTELKKLAFVNVEEGNLLSEAMLIEVKKSQNDIMLVKYRIKNQRSFTITATKPSYTYNEIKRAINIEILKYGAPDPNATLQDGNGNSISESQSLGAGTYRMTCYLLTSAGLAHSYIYLTIAESNTQE